MLRDRRARGPRRRHRYLGRGRVCRGPTDDQYDEETAPEPAAQTSPTPEPQTEPVENAPDEASPNPEDDSAAEEPAASRRRPKGSTSSLHRPRLDGRSLRSRTKRYRSPRFRTRRFRSRRYRSRRCRSPSPLRAATMQVLETAAWREASVEAGASPEPTGRLPVGTASTAPVSALPETGGPFLLTLRGPRRGRSADRDRAGFPGSPFSSRARRSRQALGGRVSMLPADRAGGNQPLVPAPAVAPVAAKAAIAVLRTRRGRRMLFALVAGVVLGSA